MGKELYIEEIECWVANHHPVFLFFFGLFLVIESAIYPFLLLYWKVWGSRRYRRGS